MRNKMPLAPLALAALCLADLAAAQSNVTVYGLLDMSVAKSNGGTSRHPLRGKPGLCLADTLDQKWATLPSGTAPHEQMRQVFAAHGLGMPNVVVETRSITALKSLVAQSGFLSWMADSIYDAERRANWVDALDIPGTVSARTLTAFKRRQGLLPAPAAKLLDELRLLTSPG